MTSTLNQQIQQFYDASSGLWEQIWGEHMHHGFYGTHGTEQKDRRQAQIDLIEELLRWINLQQATRILDVGCGIGGSTLHLANKFRAHATGITLSPVQAKRAWERAQAAGMAAASNDSLSTSNQPGAQFQVADALNMPFPDQSFDFVWSLESGEHMPDKVKFLQECYRVLQPGGTLPPMSNL
jgi:tocopherol O-methyltransferase